MRNDIIPGVSIQLISLSFPGRLGYFFLSILHVLKNALKEKNPFRNPLTRSFAMSTFNVKMSGNRRRVTRMLILVYTWQSPLAPGACHFSF